MRGRSGGDIMGWRTQAPQPTLALRMSEGAGRVQIKLDTLVRLAARHRLCGCNQMRASKGYARTRRLNDALAVALG